MPIQIRTVKPQLQIRSTNGKLEIQQPKGELEIKQEKAKMILKGEKPRVVIDQYQCFAEAGLKNNTDLSKEFKALAQRRVMEGISRINSEGTRMINIRIGNPNAIQEIAKRNLQPRALEFNYDTMPKSRPSIEIEGGQSIEWELGGVEIDYRMQKPTYNYQPGKVEGYLDPYPDIEISYIDEKR